MQSEDFAFKDYGVGRCGAGWAQTKSVLASFAAMLALAPLTIWLMTNLHDGLALLATWDRCSAVPIHYESGLPLLMATTKLELQVMLSEDCEDES